MSGRDDGSQMPIPVGGLVAFLVMEALVMLVIGWAVMTSGPGGDDEPAEPAPGQQEQAADTPQDEVGGAESGGR